MTLYEQFLNRYKGFTDIQKVAIPIIQKGSNCLVIAPTGAGKTEAAILPLIENASKIKSDGIKIIYITPLRALNRDMVGRLKWLCDLSNLTIGVRHGDTTNSERSKQTRKSPDVLITTPESLQSMLPTKGMGKHLKSVKSVVIDEIHELYSNKRGAQLSIALERLVEKSGEFQRVGLSATISNPELIKKFLVGNRTCEIASIDQRKEFGIKIEMPELPKKKIESFYDKFGLDDPSAARLEVIADSIKKSNSTLIFANTRQVVEALGSKLLYLNSVYPFGGIGVHHSSLNKEERIEIEDKFRKGELKSIIATSSLELGIDIGNIDLVIQYSSPRQSLRLAQRIGRSGHSIKKNSNGLIITSSIIDTLESIAIIDNLRDGKFESFDVEANALDVLADQICGIALDKSNIRINELISILNRSFNYSLLKTETLVKLLDFMKDQKMILFDGNMIGLTSRTRMYYYDHLSVIPDTHRYLVKNIANNRIISSLDEEFVSNNVDENSVFITKGLPWKVISIDKDIITVEPSTDLNAAIPDWSGEDIPVSYSTAKRFVQLLNLWENKSFLNQELNSKIEKMLKEQSNFDTISEEKIVMEIYDNYTILYTGLGSLANDALSRLIASYLSLTSGKNVDIKSSPYLIFFGYSDEIMIKGFLFNLGSENLYYKLRDAIIGTEFFRYKFVRIAKLFGVIDKDAIVGRSLTNHIISAFYNTPIYDEALREIMDNYFDLKNLKTFFDDLLSGKLKLVIKNLKTQSVLTKLILKSAYYSRELIMPIMPDNELVASFSKYTLDKKVELICTYCGFEFKRNLKDLIDLDLINCPSCKSPMITLKNEGYSDIVKKRKMKKPLTQYEKKIYSEMISNANLVYSYGGRAIVALSTYGIGHRTAARALLMQRTKKEKFFIDLIEAQKQFVKNKKYWSA